MFKSALVYLVLWSPILLVGCTSSGNGTQGQYGFSRVLADMESSGEIPKLDRSESLTGPDTDNNGIRDDIDRYLLTVEASEAEMLALVQVARALQAVQASDLSSENKLRELDDVTLKASACVMDTYESAVDADRESRKLQGYTANTRNRTRHYIKYNQLRDGTVFKLPRIGISCDGVAQ